MPEPDAATAAGLVFRPAAGRPARLMTWGAVQRDVDRLGTVVREAGIVPDALVGIFQGGWIVAQCLADHFPGSLMLGALACPDGSGGMRAELLATRDGLLTPAALVPGSTVLLVDEVIDSGRTARFYLQRLREDLGLRTFLACLAADTAADPSPDFAARRMDALPALVLPWRILRDFDQAMACVLRAGPMTTDQIDERLRELGHDIAPEVLAAQLRGLADTGHVSAGPGGSWASGRP